MEFEDVGGAWHDDEHESGDEAEVRRGILGEKIYDWAVIEKLLRRETEIKAMEKPGRHADAHKKHA